MKKPEIGDILYCACDFDGVSRIFWLSNGKIMLSTFSGRNIDYTSISTDLKCPLCEEHLFELGAPTTTIHKHIPKEYIGLTELHSYSYCSECGVKL